MPQPAREISRSTGHLMAFKSITIGNSLSIAFQGRHNKTCCGRGKSVSVAFSSFLTTELDSIGVTTRFNQPLHNSLASSFSKTWDQHLTRLFPSLFNETCYTKPQINFKLKSIHIIELKLSKFENYPDTNEDEMILHFPL